MNQQIDLRGTPCPLNFIRARLTLETLDPGDWLLIDLDIGEPEQTVAEGLRQAGHEVIVEDHPQDSDAVRLLIQCHGG